MTLRKLPGRRRDLVGASSLWAAEDHILSVRSHFVRETYRRFYFRDIQAIVVTRCARYILSTRSAVVGTVLAAGLFFPATRLPAGILLLACVIGWLVMSTYASCSCQIYTAVSSEELLAVHRLRSARRLLLELEPLIAAAQEGLPQPVESVGFSFAAVGNPVEAGEAAKVAAKPRIRLAPATYALLASIVADLLMTLYDISQPVPRLAWLNTVITLVEISSAIWVIVLHHRGILARAVQILAIALLLLMGGSIYLQTFQSLVEQQRRGGRAAVVIRPSLRFRQGYLGLCAVLVIAGAVLVLGSEAEEFE